MVCVPVLGGTTQLEALKSMLPCRSASKEVVRAILSAGPRGRHPSIKDVSKHGLTPLGEALRAGRCDIADLLVSEASGLLILMHLYSQHQRDGQSTHPVTCERDGFCGLSGMLDANQQLRITRRDIRIHTGLHSVCRIPFCPLFGRLRLLDDCRVEQAFSISRMAGVCCTSQQRWVRTQHSSGSSRTS